MVTGFSPRAEALSIPIAILAKKPMEILAVFRPQMNFALASSMLERLEGIQRRASNVIEAGGADFGHHLNSIHYK